MLWPNCFGSCVPKRVLNITNPLKSQNKINFDVDITRQVTGSVGERSKLSNFYITTDITQDLQCYVVSLCPSSLMCEIRPSFCLCRTRCYWDLPDRQRQRSEQLWKLLRAAIFVYVLSCDRGKAKLMITDLLSAAACVRVAVSAMPLYFTNQYDRFEY